jgi:hypothetical protein
MRRFGSKDAIQVPWRRLSPQLEPGIQELQREGCGKVKPVLDVFLWHWSDCVHRLKIFLNLLQDTLIIYQEA